jgi:ABC-type sulfate transport system substrate-binding protein
LSAFVRDPGTSSVDDNDVVRTMETNMIGRLLSILAVLMLATSANAADLSLLNVSYDPTRELYAELN